MSFFVCSLLRFDPFFSFEDQVRVYQTDLLDRNVGDLVWEPAEPARDPSPKSQVGVGSESFPSSSIDSPADSWKIFVATFTNGSQCDLSIEST